MNRNFIFWSLFIFCSSSLLAQKPNILVLVAEDMSPHLGCYGDRLVHTPNIDQLAKEGVKYTRMFATAGVCAPSRSTLITGMYQTSIGTQHMRTLGDASKPVNVKGYSRVLPPEVKCFTEYLRADGYFCTNNEKTDYQFEAPLTAWDQNGRLAHWRNRPNTSQPFFSVFNFMVTHESQIWGREKEKLEIDPKEISIPPYYSDTPLTRNAIARFLSNINEMDRQVGKVISQLKEDKLLENTIILFYTDHGDALPYVKREITNRGIHVPFIIKYPEGKYAGTEDNDLHSFVDLAPSLLSLAGVKIPPHMQGEAFLGLKKVKTSRQYVFAARDRMDELYDRVRSVRDQKFQYLKNFYPEKPYYMNVGYRLQIPMMRELLALNKEGQLNQVQSRWFEPKNVEEELYDLVNDPYQLNNLATDLNYRPKLLELRKALEAFTKRYGDKGDESESDMILSQWPNNIQPHTKEPIIEIKKKKCRIESQTEGSSIAFKKWKHNEKEPEVWQLYKKPIEKHENERIKAVAVRIGYKNSAEVVFK